MKMNRLAYALLVAVLAWMLAAATTGCKKREGDHPDAGAKAMITSTVNPDANAKPFIALTFVKETLPRYARPIEGEATALLHAFTVCQGTATEQDARPPVGGFTCIAVGIGKVAVCPPAQDEPCKVVVADCIPVAESPL